MLRGSLAALSALRAGWRVAAWRAFASAACALTLMAAIAAFGGSPAHAQTAQAAATDAQDASVLKQSVQPENNKPLLLQADDLISEDGSNRVIAKGNVEIYYNNYTLLADQVIYDRNANTLTAEGNVRIKDPDGAIINADRIVLTDDFRDGFIGSLKVVTKEEARIAAESAVRKSGDVTVFNKGVYTPCKPCANNPDAPPIWRIRADKITQVTSEQNLYFENAYLDFLGFPVLYAPYFYAPDPTVKRRSGFLAPSFGHSSDFGYTTEIPYFWNIAPNMDFTFSPFVFYPDGTRDKTDGKGASKTVTQATLDTNVLFKGELRHRLQNGTYTIEMAGIDQTVNSDGIDKSTLTDTQRKALLRDEFRGSIHSEGLFNLGSWWKLGWDATVESDDTFRRFYKLDNILRSDRVSEVHLEGQSDRNYFGTYVYNFGGLLSFDDSQSESWAHPSVDYHYVVDTPVIGGELSFDANALSLSRSEGTDSNRVIAEGAWRRQLIDGIGEVFTPFAQVRGDAYHVSNVDIPVTEDTDILRGNAVAGLQYQYPFVARTEGITHVFEPIGQVIVRPSSIQNGDVPNEDARSLIFDDTLLFDIDKFSGYDLIETGTRVNAGVQYQMQFDGGASIRAVAGESFHVAGENPFSGFGVSTGLETDQSDFVTGLYISPISGLRLVAQSRFDEDTWALRREDLSAGINMGPVSASVGYALARNFDAGTAPDNPDTDPLATGDGQEVTADASVKVTENWTAFGGFRYDIDASKPITNSLGLSYADECYSLSVTYKETFVQDRDVRPDQSVMFHFELAHLGGTSFTSDALTKTSTSDGQ